MSGSVVDMVSTLWWPAAVLSHMCWQLQCFILYYVSAAILVQQLQRFASYRSMVWPLPAVLLMRDPSLQVSLHRQLRSRGTPHVGM